MSQIKKKVVGDNEVDGSKIRLNNNQALKARNAADTGDIGLVLLDASDKMKVGSSVVAVDFSSKDLESVNDIKPVSGAEIGTATQPFDVARVVEVENPTGALSLDATNEVRADKPLRLMNAAAYSPTGLSEGSIYYDTDDDQIKVLIGSSFESIPVGTNFAQRDLSNLNTTSINENLIPESSGTKNLGSSTYLWNDTFTNKVTAASGTLRLDGSSIEVLTNLNPDTDVGRELGQSSLRFLRLYSTAVSAHDDNLQLQSNENIRLDADATEIRAGSAVQPLRFFDSDNSNWVAFKSPNTITTNLTLTLPSADGTSGQVLTTDGSGNLSFTTVASSAPTFNKQSITLTATDITNQYVDLAAEAVANSLLVVLNGVVQWEGVDYTLSVVGGVTRVTFAGDLATGGAAELVAGDILRFQYVEA